MSGSVESAAGFIYIHDEGSPEPMSSLPDLPLDTLLDDLRTLSGGRLRKEPDVRLLLGAARGGEHAAAVEELSFLAKFLHRTHGIMQRIGRDGEGYARLAEEFGRNLEKASGLARGIIAALPTAERERMEREYLALTPRSLGQLLDLFHDLGWYKNWLIDTGRGRRGGEHP
jgi:hypothetical protein